MTTEHQNMIKVQNLLYKTDYEFLAKKMFNDGEKKVIIVGTGRNAPIAMEVAEDVHNSFKCHEVIYTQFIRKEDLYAGDDDSKTIKVSRLVVSMKIELTVDEPKEKTAGYVEPLDDSVIETLAIYKNSHKNGPKKNRFGYGRVNSRTLRYRSHQDSDKGYSGSRQSGYGRQHNGGYHGRSGNYSNNGRTQGGRYGHTNTRYYPSRNGGNGDRSEDGNNDRSEGRYSNRSENGYNNRSEGGYGRSGRGYPRRRGY